MAGEAAPVELRLHIGAHKTATTHLQENLAAQQQALIAGGCVYLPQQVSRKVGFLPAVFANHLLEPSAAAKKKHFENFLNIPPTAPRRILFSEEDILGSSIDLVSGFYPHAGLRLQPFASITSPTHTQIFLAIRNYADLLPSAYSQALRDGSVLEPFAHYQQRWLANPPSWVSLIGSIRSAFPAAPLIVWTMAQYFRTPEAVLERMSGVPLKIVKAGAPENTTRLTAAAVRRAERLNPSLPPAQRRQAVAQLIAEEGGGPLFDPLPPDQKAMLTARYEADLQALSRLGIDFLG